MLSRLAARSFVCLGVLVVVLMTAVGSPTLAEDDPPDGGAGFVDIEGNSHEEDIRFIVDRGLTVGCDLNGPRYCPDDPVTRAQMAAFLVRALQLDTASPFRGVYSDVGEGVWYTRVVEAMGVYGFTDTQVSGSYRPFDPMLRSEMAIFLQKAFRLPSNNDTSTSSFQDIPPDASYARAAEAVLEAGITRGCGTDPLRYCPDDTVKRDTMAAFLARAIRASDLQKVLALAPGRELLQQHSTGADTWKVWACDNPPIREDVVVYLNREMNPYFRWLSGGRYRIRFEHGTDPSPGITEVLQRCESGERPEWSPEERNIVIGLDLWTEEFRVSGLGHRGFDAESQSFSREVWIDKRAIYDTTLYAHEIGHTFGWPHNVREPGSVEALHTRMDIMASLGQVIGTNAHNLYQLGWIDPDKVAYHASGSATYTLAPPHTGEGQELLMLPLTSERLISVGARVKERFDQNILEEGVELYEIAFCDARGCKQVFLPPGATSDDPVVLDVGESWRAQVPTLRQGRAYLTEYKVSVLHRQNRSFTVRVEETSVMVDRLSSIGVGRAGACGIMTSGTTHCWDWRGGDPPPKGVFTSLSVGHTACGIRIDGSIECWGRDNDGTQPPEGQFAALNVNGYHACGHRKDGTVECWGSDHAKKPIRQAPETEFISVSAGWSHACGIRTDNTAECWGSNYAGEISPPGGEFTSVSAGGFFSCGLRPDKSVVCWGSNENGKSRPPAGQFTYIGTGWNHACGLRANGTVSCWGTNNHGEASPPQGIFTTISVGDARACGLRPDSTVECWGRNRKEE